MDSILTSIKKLLGIAEEYEHFDQDIVMHITQLNRSVNNNLMSQIEYLTSMLYSQLGITQSILDGTADEKTMLTLWLQS